MCTCLLIQITSVNDTVIGSLGYWVTLKISIRFKIQLIVIQVLCNETVSLHLTHPSVRSSGLPLCTVPGEQCRERRERCLAVALGLSGT